MRSVPSIVMLIVLLSCAASPALADARENPEYTEAVNLGLAEFDQKNFLEARVQFARAHALYPNARTARALGMVYFELKDYVRSVQYLDEALASQERPLDSDKREKTEKLLKHALDYIARFTLDIDAETLVSVDGKSSDLRTGQDLVLSVGEHVVEFRATGRITERRTLNVQGGEHETLRVRLPSLEAAATSKPKSEPGEAPPGRPAYKNPWLWTALSVIVVGAAAGTAIALTRKTETKTDEAYPGTSGIPPLVGLSTP